MTIKNEKIEDVEEIKYIKETEDIKEIKEIFEVFEKLVSIDSPSLHERKMADYVKTLFAGIGVSLDEDMTQSITGSDAGNLFGRVEAEGKAGTTVLFAAHMDTVNPALGKKAILHEDGTVTSDGTTVLGADDLSGVTAIYETVKYIKENKLPHRPIEILITVGEELYCKGANAFDYSKVTAKEAYVLDLSGPIGTAAYAAPTLVSFEAVINGKAAHAGFRPEDGINSILAAAKAVAVLPQGHIDEVTTANIGIISGGSGTNIVSESCRISGEIRSLNHEKALQVLNQYHETFQKEAGNVGANLVWDEKLNIQAYETGLDSDVANHYAKAVEKQKLIPVFEKTFGGSDNNVFAQHGIEGLVIATSMNQVHSCREYANLFEIAQVIRILIDLSKN